MSLRRPDRNLCALDRPAMTCQRANAMPVCQLYLGPCAVWCDDETELSFGEDGLERGKEVFCCDICCAESVCDFKPCPT
jgi:hypothetical protein